VIYAGLILGHVGAVRTAVAGVGVVAFYTAIFRSVVVYGALLKELNAKLPKAERFGLFWWGPFKWMRMWSEVRRRCWSSPNVTRLRHSYVAIGASALVVMVALGVGPVFVAFLAVFYAVWLWYRFRSVA
jgi:hypothetical protein